MPTISWRLIWEWSWELRNNRATHNHRIFKSGDSNIVWVRFYRPGKLENYWRSWCKCQGFEFAQTDEHRWASAHSSSTWSTPKRWFLGRSKGPVWKDASIFSTKWHLRYDFACWAPRSRPRSRWNQHEPWYTFFQWPVYPIYSWQTTCSRHEQHFWWCS